MTCNKKRAHFRLATCASILCLSAFGTAPARAELVLSKVVVDLHAEQAAYDDIEVWNDGSDRMYVLAETSEIIAPGTPDQQREVRPDPSLSGLLVAPQRLVLEPGQRRSIRVAAVAPRTKVDRVYRVAIKPVAGPVSAEVSALKVLIGYDTLVIYRPAALVENLVGTRVGRRLTIENRGNTALELFDGMQCAADKVDCRKLQATRLYAGATLEQELPFETSVDYQVSNGRRTAAKRF